LVAFLAELFAAVDLRTCASASDDVDTVVNAAVEAITANANTRPICFPTPINAASLGGCNDHITLQFQHEPQLNYSKIAKMISVGSPCWLTAT
jgi:hypothetical protein